LPLPVAPVPCGLEGVDSIELLKRLDRYALALNRKTPVLLQINLAGESAKSGMAESNLDDALDTAVGLGGLLLEGLMIIPPLYDDARAARPFFRRLAELLAYGRKRTPTLPLRHLSMGMTHDFEEAIEEGATIVRIGTAIFGHRTLE
jgi:pyridoxal phosphate enzyme (YggS family)